MIGDFCTYLGHWPPYPLHYNDAAGLLHLLDRCGIDFAFVSGLEGFFALDVGEANEKLVQQVAGYERRLRPVGVLDPSRPTWRRHLAEGHNRLGIAGFRLHPAYHGYRLDSSEAIEVAREVGETGQPLFIATFVEEERFQSPAFAATPVPAGQILTLLEAAPQTTIVLNNLTPEEATWLEEQNPSLPNVLFEINAMDKPGDGLAALVRRFGARRLVFGSQAPFLYPEAALALVLTSSLSAAAIQAVLRENWQQHPVLRHAAGQDRNPGSDTTSSKRTDYVAHS